MGQLGAGWNTVDARTNRSSTSNIDICLRSLLDPNISTLHTRRIASDFLHSATSDEVNHFRGWPDLMSFKDERNIDRLPDALFQQNFPL